MGVEVYRLVILCLAMDQLSSNVNMTRWHLDDHREKGALFPSPVFGWISSMYTLKSFQFLFGYLHIEII